MSIARAGSRAADLWSGSGRIPSHARSLEKLRALGAATRLTKLIARSSGNRRRGERPGLANDPDGKAPEGKAIDPERGMSIDESGKKAQPIQVSSPSRPKLLAAAGSKQLVLMSRTEPAPRFLPSSLRWSGTGEGDRSRQGRLSAVSSSPRAKNAQGRDMITTSAASALAAAPATLARDCSPSRKDQETTVPQAARSSLAPTFSGGRLRTAIGGESKPRSPARAFTSHATSAPPRARITFGETMPVLPAGPGAGSVGLQAASMIAQGQRRSSGLQQGGGAAESASDQTLILSGEIVIDGRRLGSLISERQGRGLLSEPRGARQVNARALPMSSALNLPPP